MTRIQQKTCAGACALLLLVGAAGTASAEDLAGSLGVGGQQTLGGATGISLNYYPSNDLGFAGTFLFDNFESSTVLMLGGDLFYRLRGWEQVNLNLVGNVSLSYVDAGMSATTFGFGFGVRPEWWPAPNMSFFLQGGIIAQIIPDGPAMLSHDGTGAAPIGEGFLINLDTDLAGAAGFTVWWR